MDCQRTPSESLRFVYTINRDYIPFALVSMLSVIESQTQPSTFYIVHDGDLNDIDQAKMRRLIDAKGASVDFHRVGKDFPRQFAEHSSWDVSVLFRLALPQILPADIDRVLYLDGDTLVRRPFNSTLDSPVWPPFLKPTRPSSDSVCRSIRPTSTAACWPSTCPRGAATGPAKRCWTG